MSEIAAVGGQTLSEFVRDCLVRASEGTQYFSEPEILLGEILALRAIVLNQMSRSSGEKIPTRQEMLDLIGRADKDKRLKARQRFGDISKDPNGGSD
jgi:hypothetical protein